MVLRCIAEEARLVVGEHAEMLRGESIMGREKVQTCTGDRQWLLTKTISTPQQGLRGLPGRRDSSPFAPVPSTTSLANLKFDRMDLDDLESTWPPHSLALSAVSGGSVGASG